ncbi:hypothetical protein GQ54DRAFT_75479 [Martensiomyces pterosporus]|nr:hypothetical protein GQ54DRAFT_75479 [Martensiomyces pterosporus]
MLCETLGKGWDLCSCMPALWAGILVRVFSVNANKCNCPSVERKGKVGHGCCSLRMCGAGNTAPLSMHARYLHTSNGKNNAALWLPTSCSSCLVLLVSTGALRFRLGPRKIRIQKDWLLMRKAGARPIVCLLCLFCSIVLSGWFIEESPKGDTTMRQPSSSKP